MISEGIRQNIEGRDTFTQNINQGEMFKGERSYFMIMGSGPREEYFSRDRREARKLGMRAGVGESA